MDNETVVLTLGHCQTCGGFHDSAAWCAENPLAGIGKIVAIEAELAAVRKWQDAVLEEVLADGRLPCDPCEVSIEDVPALLAAMAGRIEHADDYEWPQKRPEPDEVASGVEVGDG